MTCAESRSTLAAILMTSFMNLNRERSSNLEWIPSRREGAAKAAIYLLDFLRKNSLLAAPYSTVLPPESIK